MIYRFDEYAVDTESFVLRRDGAVVDIEPQVFDFLVFMLKNPDRLVTRGEILKGVWDGRIVSDAAVDSRVRSLRAAIGDDGRAQRRLRTVRGRGLRFLGPVTVDDVAAGTPTPVAAQVVQVEPPRPAAPSDAPFSSLILGADVAQTAKALGLPDERAGRPSIAVLPFSEIGHDATTHALSRALPHDLITGLSRLRWLFVIARASSFKFKPDECDPFQAARALNARYLLDGSVEVFAGRLTVMAELVDTERGGVVWADQFAGSVDDVHALRQEIGLAIIAALELRIPQQEADRAAVKSTEDLDAWGAYHLGLRHMYRFTRRDNDEAIRLFSRATSLDTQFCRAHAALSFAHFQSAFIHFSADADADRRTAMGHAEKAVMLDPLEPYANYAMGRALWSRSDLSGAQDYLARCIDLNPNHAQGHYSTGLVDMLTGRMDAVGMRAHTALKLSPYDPMRYGMLMLHSLNLLSKGEYAEATVWAIRSAREPNAHAVMELLAAMTCELGGEHEEAARWIASARRKNPHFGKADFFRSLQFQDPKMRKLISEAFDRLGLS
ncbi:MAG: winged helix-turn-helix domain-containing protein [Pseudomonadota bacterium]